MDRMAMSACAMAATVLISVAAMGQPYDFEGSWGRVGNQCASRGDIIPIVITSSELLFYESRCGLADVKPVGEAGMTWQVDAECSGEGEQWIDNYIFALTADSEPQTLVMIDMGYGDAWLLERCD